MYLRPAGKAGLNTHELRCTIIGLSFLILTSCAAAVAAERRAEHTSHGTKAHFWAASYE